MKRLILAVAAVAGLGLGVVHAEDIKVDFDGKALGGINFMEAIKTADSSQNDNIACEKPKPAAVLTVEAEPVFSPRMLIAMDEAIGSAMAYVNANNLAPQLRDGFECLRDQGTLEQKYDFVYAVKGSTHTLPENCLLPTRSPGVCTCSEYSYRDVCHDVTVYKDVCEQVGGLCAAGSWVGGVWTMPECTATYMICKAVATIIPSCIPERYCSNWNCEPPIGG
ncbi:MAG TPA: hypothetical protein DCL44_04725 [Elusimicrobia bacterium]|nr:hypothetical protein [Elusimicrobiota bacterium]